MKVAIVANSAWYLYNFRRTLMRSLHGDGHQAVAISPRDEFAARLRDEGFDWIEWQLLASGTHPMREILSVLALRKLLARHAFDAAFTFTPKPNIYTGLAAVGTSLRHVPNVSGLGRAFIDRGWLTRLVKPMYRFAFRRAKAVVFQNDDDLQVFEQEGLVEPRRVIRVPGSGVDLERFTPAPLPAGTDPVFLFVGRVLRDKGIVELVNAARTVRRRHPLARFVVLGRVAADNPSAIPEAQVRSWVQEGVIEVLGHVDDVRPHLRAAHCVVLPSYREGVPRVLLEAAATARPCIATDVPGCRDAVVDQITGYLCAARNADALADSMLRFIAAGPPLWARLGRNGRQRVEQRFSEQIVLETYKALARDLDT